MLYTSINESQNQHDSLLDALQSIFGGHRTLENFASQLRQPQIVGLSFMFLYYYAHGAGIAGVRKDEDYR
jgi:hypothetical protein